MDNIDDALHSLRNGMPILIYDSSSRENEVDYVVHASVVDADVVYEMRILAGGLICYALPIGVARELGLKYAYEYMSHDPLLARLVGKTPSYGDKPAFSVWVNHVNVRTGIQDEDRALTIRELDRVNEMVFQGRINDAREYFADNFLAPGHVPILIGRRLSERRGHTELSLHMAAMAGLRPSMVVVEMLSKGRALSLEEAKRISREYGYPLVTLKDVVGEAEKYGEDLYCRYKLC
ncbi:MAG: 3,4-dihydroxy-2-butanone-4-phosphate synthase [Pyrodictiaceae archaeon]